METKPIVPDRREPGAQRWLALALLGTAFFMSILDGTIVYVAIPPIEADLGFGDASLHWVMSGYLLSFGGLLLLGGRAADLLGRRRVFMAGTALFGLSSLAFGLSWGPEILIGSRVVQGSSAAIMAPSALSILMTVFPEGPDRNKALGIWGGIGGTGATAGLLLGGPIAGRLGWEWVFFVNVPVAVALLCLSPLLLPESRDRGLPRHFDLGGAVTVTAALVLLVFAIAEAPEAGWLSAPTTGTFTGSLALLALFVAIESRAEAPLVPLRVFRSRSLVGGNVVLLLAGMAIDGMLLTLTLYAQGVLGYSTLQFGLMAAALTAMSIVGALGGQELVTRFGPRPLAAAGMVLLGAGGLLLTGVPVDGSYLSDLLLGLVVFGTGLGAAFVAAQIAALSGVAERESGLAAGLVDTSFSIGGALGLAIVSSVAIARADALLEDPSQVPELAAVTEGHQAAFAVAAAIAVLGVLAALALLGRMRKASEPTRQALPLSKRRPWRPGRPKWASRPRRNDREVIESGAGGSRIRTQRRRPGAGK